MTKSIIDIRTVMTADEIPEAIELLRYYVDGTSATPFPLDVPHRVSLIEETLSDGSKTYSLRIDPEV